MHKVKVLITNEVGEVLDAFWVWPNEYSKQEDRKPTVLNNEARLSAAIRNDLEMDYEVEDTDDADY